jgi:DNA-binding NarL/FixJ family response regulator
LNELPKIETSVPAEQKTEIWIVEDQTLFRECLVEIINSTKDLKCRCSFGSCEDALRQLENDSSPAVILLDIGLPGMSGIDGIQKFKELSPPVQIIILTVFEDSEKVFQAICAGASGYLLKSATETEILNAINEVLKGGSPINTKIARKVLTAFAALNPPLNDYKLSEREEEILLQMINGLTCTGISKVLDLSYHTIDTHIRSIYNKLHVNNRTSAVAKAIKERIL